MNEQNAIATEQNPNRGRTVIIVEEIDTDDEEPTQRFAVPVTLREIKHAGIEYEGEFGSDENEIAELDDDEEILRLVFGVHYTSCFDAGECEQCEHFDLDQCTAEDEDTWHDDNQTFDIECLQQRIGSSPEWESIIITTYKNCNTRVENVRRIEELLKSIVPDYNKYIGRIIEELIEAI